MCLYILPCSCIRPQNFFGGVKTDLGAQPPMGTTRFEEGSLIEGKIRQGLHRVWMMSLLAHQGAVDVSHSESCWAVFLVSLLGLLTRLLFFCFLFGFFGNFILINSSLVSWVSSGPHCLWGQLFFSLRNIAKGLFDEWT